MKHGVGIDDRIGHTRIKYYCIMIAGCTLQFSDGLRPDRQSCAQLLFSTD